MFIEERHAAILGMLAEAGSITTADIQKQFGISYDSAKRDLRILEEKGALRRTHGGAIPVGELAIGRPRRVAESPSEVNPVIERAAELIGEGETVYLPAGELGLLFAKSLPVNVRLTVAVNSIAVAEFLHRRQDVTVIFLGGVADADGVCTDSFATEIVRHLRFDKAFIATSGISPAFGISHTNSAQLGFLCSVLDSARSTVGLYPAENLGCESAFSVCPTSRLDVLITDAKLCGEVIAEYKKQGVKRIICE